MRRRLGADLLPGPGHAEPGHLPPGAPVTSQGDTLEEYLVTSYSWYHNRQTLRVKMYQTVNQK